VQSALEEAQIPEDLKQQLSATWPADVALAVQQSLADGTLLCGRANKVASEELVRNVELENRRMHLAYLQARIAQLNEVGTSPSPAGCTSVARTTHRLFQGAQLGG
jgi:hypothetical protein